MKFKFTLHTREPHFEIKDDRPFRTGSIRSWLNFAKIFENSHRTEPKPNFWNGLHNSFSLQSCLHPASMENASDSELNTVCSLVNMFYGGIPGGVPDEGLSNMIGVWMKRIHSMSNADCKRLADAGDLERMHEYALRVAAGVKLPSPDTALAKKYWMKIVASPKASPRNKATAHAHLIACTGILFGPEGRSINLGDCMRAGEHAELAAQGGLGSAPYVLLLGKTLRGFRHGEHKEAFGKWKHFWSAFDARDAEYQTELDQQAAKRSVRPSRYKCAAAGCPVEALKGHMLRSGAGKCEEAYKPSYCTKECQRADWKNHKPMCKPGLDVPKVESTQTPIPLWSHLSPSHWKSLDQTTSFRTSSNKRKPKPSAERDIQ
ncbi:hypothetical protein GGX14DRAFT_693078 [Mycena pura]|uniref:MYND-type domain-containing protein n=1 Tax=Mycena pura TaxID=153505 RepID=A0AAD6YR07_9AGAR|nr:hypothetical protein GGX14DRAFT_693078 [Mycena pura]